MLALRSLVGVALLSSAWAEECGADECPETEAPESSSLIQTKPQRQDPKRKESDELAVNLLAQDPKRNESDELAVNLLSRASGTADATVVADNDKCDLDRTMKSKGKQRFEEGPQKSIVNSDNEYQFASEEEFLVLDKINEKRREGFSCEDPDTGNVEVFEPKCRNKDLVFDCQLWFAAKQHSEDMGARNYYAHDTRAPFPSNKSYETEPFNKRVKAYAWGMAAHKEVLMGARGDQDTADVIVQSWLDSYSHCLALGTKNAQIAGIGRAPCTARANGVCVHSIGTFTGGLFQQRGFLASWSSNLDTSCYPDTRDKEHR